MPVIWIPSLLRDLVEGHETVTVPGQTVREAVDALEERYPGVKARLFEDDRLRPGISVVVDGQATSQRLRTPLTEMSEVHFLPALSGGAKE